MKKVIYHLLILNITIVSCFLAWTLIVGYTTSIESLLKLSNQQSNHDKVFALMTKSKFYGAQIIELFLILGLVFLFLKRENFYTTGITVFKYVNNALRRLLSNFFHSSGPIIVFIPLATCIYCAFVIPVSYDEAYTYLSFTTKTPLTSALYYPLPNNHILHSIITNFTHYIPFLSDLVCLRISNIFITFLMWMICFSFWKKFYSEKFSLILTGISSMLFMSVYYSYMSRGYELVSLFFVVSLYCTYQIIQHSSEKRYWIIFSISSILGFYTMPSYLYPFLTLHACLLLGRSPLIRSQKSSFFSTIAIVAVIYTPIILVNGLKAIVGNVYVQPIPRLVLIEKLPSFFSETLQTIFGIPWLFIAPLMAISLLYVVYKKDSFHIKTISIFIAAPFLLLGVHSVIPFPRTFYYYSVIVAFLCLYPAYSFIQRFSTKTILLCVIVAQVLLFVNFTNVITEYENYSISSHHIITQIIGAKNYFINSEQFDIFLRFELQTSGYKSVVPNVVFPPVKMSSDTMTSYDYVVIDKKYDMTQNRKPTYTNRLSNIYSSKYLSVQ